MLQEWNSLEIRGTITRTTLSIKLWLDSFTFKCKMVPYFFFFLEITNTSKLERRQQLLHVYPFILKNWLKLSCATTLSTWTCWRQSQQCFNIYNSYKNEEPNQCGTPAAWFASIVACLEVLKLRYYFMHFQLHFLRLRILQHLQQDNSFMSIINHTMLHQLIKTIIPPYYINVAKYAQQSID